MNIENLIVYASRAKIAAVDAGRMKKTTPLGTLKIGADGDVESVLYAHIDSQSGRIYRSPIRHSATGQLTGGMLRLNARSKTGDRDDVQVYLSPKLEEVLKGLIDYRKSVGIIRVNSNLVANLFVHFEFESATPHITDSGNFRFNARPMKDREQQADAAGAPTQTVSAAQVDGDGIPGEPWTAQAEAAWTQVEGLGQSEAPLERPELDSIPF